MRLTRTYSDDKMVTTRSIKRDLTSLEFKKNFGEKKKKIKVQKNSIGADKLQSKKLKMNNANETSVNDLLKLCRPLKVHLTRFIDTSNRKSKYTIVVSRYL